MILFRRRAAVNQISVLLIAVRLPPKKSLLRVSQRHADSYDPRQILAVAACMGHSDGSMVAKVYSHIDKDDAHLKRALID